MKNLVLVVLLLLSGQTDTDELQKLFHNFNVQSIDASIVQVIAETGKETQRYEGRYRAYNDCMRIDYSKPFRQIVIYKRSWNPPLCTKTRRIKKRPPVPSNRIWRKTARWIG